MKPNSPASERREAISFIDHVTCSVNTVLSFKWISVQTGTQLIQPVIDLSERKVSITGNVCVRVCVCACVF